MPEEPPQHLKLYYALWTLPLIRDLVRRHLEKTLTTSSVSHTMKLLGFPAQKPLHEAWQQNPVLVRQWETGNYPGIRAEARTARVEIYFAGGSAIRSGHHAGATWASIGHTPVVHITGRCFRLTIFSAVSPQGLFFFILHKGSGTANVLKTSLKQLLVGAEYPIFLVAGDHPNRKSRLVQDTVKSTNGRLRLYFIPAHAPRLIPAEQVWAHVKRLVLKRGVESQEQMSALAVDALRRIQHLPEILRWFARDPACRYALPCRHFPKRWLIS